MFLNFNSVQCTRSMEEVLWSNVMHSDFYSVNMWRLACLWLRVHVIIIIIIIIIIIMLLLV